MKGTIVVLVCHLVVLVNSVAVYKNGQCIDPDPSKVNRMESKGHDIRYSNWAMDQIEALMANIIQRLTVAGVKHSAEEKAQLERQIGEAKELDSTLKGVKCTQIDVNLRDPSLEEKYKVGYVAVAARTAIVRQKLNSLAAVVSTIEV